MKKFVISMSITRILHAILTKEGVQKLRKNGNLQELMQVRKGEGDVLEMNRGCGGIIRPI